ncbi:MAG TPA: 23S rRNA (pseudouridine(1915)-N(3))-methyltransferase RlmH [Alphaproteobacteria bacterium]|nr:23S rRNA (pseudouridine(1915)-N(3))-methyltransferase RlmH [Alphaproteobacteria bacterium]
MRLGLLAVGRLKAGPILTLFQDYSRRLAWPLLVIEVEERRRLTASERKTREGALLLAEVAAQRRKLSDPVVIALDERGEGMSSAAFAARLGGWRDAGRDIVFVIGGDQGLSATVLNQADATLSLGPMTWPHLMVRMLMLEQLFRAQSILTGHPYHRE